MADTIAYVRKSYVAQTVTLTNANQAYNIFALVQAQIAPQICPGMCREFNIQSEETNTDEIWIGDNAVGVSNKGYRLQSPGTSRTYRSADTNNVQVASKFAFSQTAGQKINVEIDCA